MRLTGGSENHAPETNAAPQGAPTRVRAAREIASTRGARGTMPFDAQRLEQAVRRGPVDVAPLADAAPPVTRGHGVLERFLAAQRCKMANRLIPDALRGGTLVDIGYGSYPLFLAQAEFRERIGIERPRQDGAALCAVPGLTLLAHDLERGEPLPLQSGSVSAVTMLAVFEHISPPNLAFLVREIHRALAPGGVYVLTTPARWTEPILRTMSAVGLVSAEEIHEHKMQYTRRMLARLLTEGGFARYDLRFGSFELGMNLWATARKR